jgi:hypothetical protein
MIRAAPLSTSSGGGGTTGPLVLLYTLTNADMQSTADQAFVKNGTWSEALPTYVKAYPKTGGTSVTCSGGIYNQASKAGTADLPATASWLLLDSGTTPKKYLTFTSNVQAGNRLQNLVTTGTWFLSLTTGSTAACTADIYVYGEIIS